MKKMNLLKITLGLLVLTVVITKWKVSPRFENFDEMQSLSPNVTLNLQSASPLYIDENKSQLLTEASSQTEIVDALSKDDLRQKISDLDQAMKELDVLEKMKNPDLDEGTRQECFNLITYKAKLLVKLSEIEIAQSQDLLRAHL